MAVVATRAPWRLPLACAAAAVLLAASPGLARAEEPTRIVAVRVAADDHYRARADWEAELRGLFATVSDAYDRHFAIRLHVAEIVPWTTGSAAMPSWQLIDRLPRDVSAGGVDVLIGLSGPTCQGRGFTQGVAWTFGNTALVVRCGAVPVGEVEATLSHEIAHLFGAFHVKPGPRSVMRRGGAADEFDDQTARVIRLMRGHDFARGVVGMDEPTRQRWLAIYREEGTAEGRNPLLAALRHHALTLRDEGDRKAAIASLREVIAIEPAAAWPHADIGMIRRAAGKLHEAVAEFHHALAKDSRNVEARTGLGLVHLQRRDLDAAVRELRRALAVDRHHAPARRALGGILLERKEYLAALDELAGFTGDEVQARLHLAAAYQGAGRRREAWVEIARLREKGVAVPQGLVDEMTRHLHP